MSATEICSDCKHQFLVDGEDDSSERCPRRQFADGVNLCLRRALSAERAAHEGTKAAAAVMRGVLSFLAEDAAHRGPLWVETLRRIREVLSPDAGKSMLDDLAVARAVIDDSIVNCDLWKQRAGAALASLASLRALLPRLRGDHYTECYGSPCDCGKAERDAMIDAALKDGDSE